MSFSYRNITVYGKLVSAIIIQYGLTCSDKYILNRCPSQNTQTGLNNYPSRILELPLPYASQNFEQRDDESRYINPRKLHLKPLLYYEREGPESLDQVSISQHMSIPLTHYAQAVSSQESPLPTATLNSS